MISRTRMSEILESVFYAKTTPEEAMDKIFKKPISNPNEWTRETSKPKLEDRPLPSPKNRGKP